MIADIYEDHLIRSPRISGALICENQRIYYLLNLSPLSHYILNSLQNSAMRIPKIFFLLLLLGSAIASNAQRHRDPKPQPVARFKPPVLFSSIGGRKDSATVTVQDAGNIITMPLKITDAKNNIYTVTDYQLAYKQIVVTEDESMNGKVSLTTGLKSSSFKTTPISSIWIQTLQAEMHKGEQLTFFGIIVKDSQGRVMYAPDINLILQ